MNETDDIPGSSEAEPAVLQANGAKEALAGRSFVSIIIAQFLGAFNDNAFKQLILLLAVGLSLEAGGDYHLSLIHI